MKKILALVIAMLMVLAVSVGAWAVETKQTDQVGKDDSTYVITKDIVIYNTDGSKVYEPNITYTYTITSGTAGKTISDNHTTEVSGVTTADPITVKTKQGPDGGLLIKGNNAGATAGTSAKLVFGATTEENSAANTDSSKETVEIAAAKKVTRKIEVSFDVSKFSGIPGVYRYKLAESIASGDTDYATAGVTKGAAADDRYLDVYVRWNSEMIALEVYGLTMFTTDEDIIYKADATASSFKVTGYDVTTEEAIKSSGSTEAGVDTYHTYNLTVEKKVAGSMGDKKHEFPFSVELNESNATAVEFYTDTTNSTDYAKAKLEFTSNKLEVNTALASSGDGAVTLKDSDKIIFVGLPMTTTATVKEKNDTGESYKATAKANTTSGENTDLTMTSSGSGANVTWATADNAVTSAKSESKDSNTITVTNTLEEISPTGVALRFAPYILMAAAAVVLLTVMSRRRKDTQDKSNSI